MPLEPGPEALADHVVVDHISRRGDPGSAGQIAALLAQRLIEQRPPP
jgi:hypothetical protein